MEFEVAEENSDYFVITGVAHPSLVDEEFGKHSTYMSPSQIKRMAEIPEICTSQGRSIPVMVEHGMGNGMGYTADPVGFVHSAHVNDVGDLGVLLLVEKRKPGAMKVVDAVRRKEFKELSMGLSSEFKKVYDETSGADLEKCGIRWNEISLCEKGNLERCLITSYASDRAAGFTDPNYKPSEPQKESESTMSNGTQNDKSVNSGENDKSTQTSPEQNGTNNNGGKDNQSPNQPPSSNPANNDWEARLKRLEEERDRFKSEAERERVNYQEQLAEERKQRQQIEEAARKERVEAAKSKWSPVITEAKEAAKGLADLVKDERDKNAHLSIMTNLEQYEKNPEWLLEDGKVSSLESIARGAISSWGLYKAHANRGNPAQETSQTSQTPSAPDERMNVGTNASLSSSGRQTDQEKEIQRLRGIVRNLTQSATSGKSSSPSPFDGFSSRYQPQQSQQPAAPQQPEKPEEPEEMLDISVNNPFAYIALDTRASNRQPDLETLREFEQHGLVKIETVASSKARKRPFNPREASRAYAREVWKKYPRTGPADFRLTRKEESQYREEMKTARSAKRMKLTPLQGHSSHRLISAFKN